MTRTLASLPTALVLVACVSAGCGKPEPKFGQVTGVVKLRGKPTKDLLVRFLPDPGPEGVEISVGSSGITDDQGRYSLQYAYQGKPGEGAVIGRHRVCVEEANRPHTPQGQAPPPRKVPEAYSNPGMTPLSADVAPGEQELNFEIQ
ncbi:MAG: hypothetical protein KF688_10455 [Pirellulales bacterium]|nr:hypothetical protein [Pirellulales bacterium]